MNKVERDGGWEDGCERCGESMRLMGRREQQRERERERGRKGRWSDGTEGAVKLDRKKHREHGKHWKENEREL